MIKENGNDKGKAFFSFVIPEGNLRFIARLRYL
jgi:hypothetical protein